MENRTAIPYILLLATLVVYTVPALAEDCAELWQEECGNGACYTMDKWCDKKDDCGNNNDEERCSYNDTSYCSRCHFTCHDESRCIINMWVCDGQNDCLDGSDEKNCPDAKEAARFMCHYGRTPKPKLAPPTENAVMAAATNRTVVPSIEALAEDCAELWQEECGNGACYTMDKWCDKKDDCGNNNDEERCSYNDTSYCSRCHFTCHDESRCIINMWVCDGQNDCLDGSDEKNCPDAKEAARFMCHYGRTPKPKLAPPTENAVMAEATNRTVVPSVEASAEDCAELWQEECGNGACYTMDKWCDKKDDCGNNNDEERCSYNDTFYCSRCHFTCRDESRCIINMWVCDGQNDCLDGSDEKDCPDAKEAARFMCHYGRTPKPKLAPPTEDAASTTSISVLDCNVDDGGFPCMDGRCLLPVQVCDGVKDCIDGADEGRFCQLVRHGNQQPQQPQPQQQHEHGLHSLLADLHLQCRVLLDPSLNSSNAAKEE
ncbi:hypothetical protein MTO96_022985 [Rhipicephalus appendiculatus]